MDVEEDSGSEDNAGEMNMTVQPSLHQNVEQSQVNVELTSERANSNDSSSDEISIEETSSNIAVVQTSSSEVQPESERINASTLQTAEPALVEPNAHMSTENHELEMQDAISELPMHADTIGAVEVVESNNVDELPRDEQENVVMVAAESAPIEQVYLEMPEEHDLDVPVVEPNLILDEYDDDELPNNLEPEQEDIGDRVDNAVDALNERLNFQPETWVVTRPYLRDALRTLIRQARRDGRGLAAYLSRDNRMQQLRHILFIANYQNLRGQRNEADAGNDSNPLSSSDDDMDVVEPDEQHEQEHDITISFDTNLPAEHSYLGANMDRVSGVNYIEAGQHYRLMLFKHEHILFPGEILPFMLSGSVIEHEIDNQNGLLFGVCFPFLRNTEQEDKLYGVTCQIYEKGTDELGKSLFKSRALQRFVTKASYLKGPLQFIAHSTIRCYGDVKILPEIYLPEPSKCLNLGSMSRFRDLPKMETSLKRFQAASSPLPSHFYEKYNVGLVVEKARSVLAQQKLEAMPNDPIQQSFWLVRNLHLSENLTNTIFTLDSVNKRMEIIGSSFEKDAVFVCRFCSKKIANCSELFAMSKHGVQTQYCNSAGYIHETNTVYNICRDAVTYSGQPSSDFSWFPGYQWQIIICKLCSHHIGWKFTAEKPNLEPKTFFGITSTSVRITATYTEPPPRDHFYRMLLRQIIPNNVQ